MSKINSMPAPLVYKLYCLTIIRLAENLGLYIPYYDETKLSTIESYTKMAEKWNSILIGLIEKMLPMLPICSDPDYKITYSILDQLQNYINIMVERKLPLFSIEAYVKTLQYAVKCRHDASHVIDILVRKNIAVIHDIINTNISNNMDTINANISKSLGCDD